MGKLQIGMKVVDTKTAEIGVIKNLTGNGSIAFVVGDGGSHWTVDSAYLKPYTEKEESAKPAEDRVNHPTHYTNGKYECIDVMEGQFGTNATANYCHLAAFKYMWRAGSKHEAGMTTNQKGIEDLEKAVWYIKKEVELRKKGRCA